MSKKCIQVSDEDLEEAFSMLIAPAKNGEVQCTAHI
jgi:hypothetical protein